MTVHEKAGTARFVDPHTIETESGLRLQADKIILCAGGITAPISARLRVDRYPQRCLERNCGPVVDVGHRRGATGVQLRLDLSNAFGSEVQLFQAGPRILATEDEDVRRPSPPPSARRGSLSTRISAP